MPDQAFSVASAVRYFRILIIAGAALVFVFRQYTKTAKQQEIGARSRAIYAETPKDPNERRVISENVVAYTTANEALLAARQKAKDTLPRFVEILASGKPGTYSVKFPLTQNGKVEHIWLQVDSTSDGKFLGRLANKPVNGDAYTMGQKMSVPGTDIEDWMVRSSDGIYGGHVARLQIQDLPEPQRTKLAAQFRD